MLTITAILMTIKFLLFLLNDIIPPARIFQFWKNIGYMKMAKRGKNKATTGRPCRTRKRHLKKKIHN